MREGPLIPPHDYKIRTIASILGNSRGRHFVLVGDSGEHDPESYGQLARDFPDRIDAIYIRNISADECSRYKAAFKDVPPEKIHFLPANLAHKTESMKMLDCYSY